MQTKRVVPLCCYCDRIRDENDYWLFIPGYAGRHVEVEYLPTVCPDCYERYGALEIEELQGK